MDFWELIKVMARRWFVVVPIIAVTAALAVSLPAGVDPSYKATGTMIIVEPAGDAADLNPFASAGLGTNAEALSIVSTTPASKRQVAEAGLSTLYTVESDGSVLQVDAEGSSVEQAANTVRFVEQLLVDQLTQQQTNVGAPPESFLTLVPLVENVAPTPVFEDQRRMRILVLAVGVLAAMLGAMAAEGLIRVYRARNLRESGGARRRRPGTNPPGQPLGAAQEKDQQPPTDARRLDDPVAPTEPQEPAAGEQAFSGPPLR